MIRQLLDIAPVYPGRRLPRIRRQEVEHIIEQPRKLIKDSVENVKDSLNDSIQCVKDSVDSVSSANVIPTNGNTGGDDMTMLMWSIIVVLAVLAMCLYFVYSYRKHHLLSRARLG